MQFRNTTQLDQDRLRELLERHTHPYQHNRLRVCIRYSRRAAFSGACYYADARIFVNLGRRNRYPFMFDTHTAKARTQRGSWSRARHRLVVPSEYELVLFVYLHELYHFLVKSAGRCVRRKEAMCDRFAARVLIDEYGCPLLDVNGRSVPREAWDFQDLSAFVSAAPRNATLAAPGAPPATEMLVRAAVPVAGAPAVPLPRVRPPRPPRAARSVDPPGQLLLWRE
ncbi:MAG: hypothetical protein U1D55_19710 [Phycisphaerae bacterium]